MDGINLQLFSPNSDWRPSYPPVSIIGAQTVGIDVETKDPLLTKRGPGSFRGDGYCVGISVAVDNKAWYLPFAHTGGDNLNREEVIHFVKQLVKRANVLVGANILYDVEWLESVGIPASDGPRLVDVQMVDALIDEEQDHYSLDALCKKYLSTGKDEELLREAATSYGVDPKSELYKLPARFVGPYACWDALSALKIWKQQEELLFKDDLLPIFLLECELTPIIWKMRQLGIPVDLDQARALKHRLLEQETVLVNGLQVDFDCAIDPWSGKSLAQACNKFGITYRTTSKRNPSFEGDWIKNHDHPLLQGVAKIREVNRLRSMFVEQWIFDNHCNGRVHPTWHQLRNPEGGTRTGRMSASNPNPQQIPSKSDQAALIRSMFIPDKGLQWCKMDYSQQEPRLTVHYASLLQLTGSQLIVQAYKQNSATDFYQFLAEAAGVSRRESKTITLGRIYGMGAESLSDKLGLDRGSANGLFDQFDESVPFVQELSDSCTRAAADRGYIRTLLGRKRHFNFWEPRDFELRKSTLPLRYDEAKAAWGEIRRAYVRKSLNALIQGSAADMTKKTMILIYHELGLVPYMQVHDELNYGVETEKQANQIKQLAEESVKLAIPIKADINLGKHWQ